MKEKELYSKVVSDSSASYKKIRKSVLIETLDFVVNQSITICLMAGFLLLILWGVASIANKSLMVGIQIEGGHLSQLPSLNKSGGYILVVIAFLGLGGSSFKEIKYWWQHRKQQSGLQKLWWWLSH